MAFVEYILLALLGATGGTTPGGTPSNPAIRTLGANVIVQPAGGIGFAQTGGDKKVIRSASGKKATATAKSRHHNGHRRRHKVSALSGKKAT